MKYECWCEWLKEYWKTHLKMGWLHPSSECTEHTIEDVKHHAYLEGRKSKLPTVDELDAVILNGLMKGLSPARAVHTYLEERQ